MKISVIVPVYNAQKTLSACLDALLESDDAAFEIIAVDDGSTDLSAQIAEGKGVKVLHNIERKGPGSARNHGAQHASGEILFFVDSDVLVQKNTLSMISNLFEEDSRLAAVFGSYDDSPAEQNFLSQYKNLLHHLIHQNSNEDAVTFWAGCGAIRKVIFHEMGGFDSGRYPHPSIEDIDLGIRLSIRGQKIRLEKSLQVKHLKQWRFDSLLRADILYRAVPWSRLILRSGFLPQDLNLRWSHRASAVLVALLPLPLVYAVFAHPIAATAAAFSILLLLILLNREVYVFFLRKKSVLFTLGVIPWHLFYYLYSGIVFVYCSLEHVWRLVSGRRQKFVLPSVDPVRSGNLEPAEATSLKSTVVE